MYLVADCLDEGELEGKGRNIIEGAKSCKVSKANLGEVHHVECTGWHDVLGNRKGNHVEGIEEPWEMLVDLDP